MCNSSLVEVIQAVTGGQLTRDLVITHNELFPKQKVSLEDLRPSLDPDHVCRGSVPLKNGILTCGCPIRAEAPEPITHRDVANFDNLSIEALRIKIIEQYICHQLSIIVETENSK